jgi:hypothetical protein
MPAKNRKQSAKAKSDGAASQPSPPLDDKEPKGKKPYRWTVLVYLAGDNNLAEECAFAISEMKQADYIKDDRMQILVQFDPKASRLPTQRFSIKDEIAHPISESRKSQHAGPNPRYRLGETYTGSPRTLYDFIAWGIQTYPAYSYLVVVSGHGGGVEENFLLRDENPNGTISLREIKDVFACVNADFDVVVDIVGLDTCLMSMAEVSYQLKDNVNLLVGSEGYSPLGGWPYRPILEMLSRQSAHSDIKPNDPNADRAVLKREREGVARGIVCEYANYYFEYIAGGIDVDQAAIDIGKCDLLAPLVAKLAGRLKYLLDVPTPPPLLVEALVLAHWDSQSYDGEIYVDLRDFCSCLLARTDAFHCSDADVTTACKEIRDLIGEDTRPCPGDKTTVAADGSGNYVLKSCYTGPSLQYSYGVSVYFPWYEVMPYYGDLDFAQATKWHEFLDVYVRKTRRPRRIHAASDRELLGDPDSTIPLRQSSGKQSSGKDDRPIIRSMRNPPIALRGLSACFTDDQAEWVDKLE